MPYDVQLIDRGRVFSRREIAARSFKAAARKARAIIRQASEAAGRYPTDVVARVAGPARAVRVRISV